jgi:hypothetical protein
VKIGCIIALIVLVISGTASAQSVRPSDDGGDAILWSANGSVEDVDASWNEYSTTTDVNDAPIKWNLSVSGVSSTELITRLKDKCPACGFDSVDPIDWCPSDDPPEPTGPNGELNKPELPSKGIISVFSKPAAVSPILRNVGNYEVASRKTASIQLDIIKNDQTDVGVDPTIVPCDE